MPLQAGVKRKYKNNDDKYYTKSVNDSSKKTAKQLPKKSKVTKPSQQKKPANAYTDTATNAAQTIKNNVEGKKGGLKKSSVSTSGYVQKTTKANNVAKTIAQRQWDNEKGHSYKTDSKENIGRTGANLNRYSHRKIKPTVKERMEDSGLYVNKVDTTPRVKKEDSTPTRKSDRDTSQKKPTNRNNYNKHRLDEGAKDIQNRALSGALEGNNVFDKAFNPMGKFISNAMDSTIDNSLLGAGATLATGKKITDGAYYDNPYEAQRHQGISAGAGRMAGLALNYGLMRSAVNPQLTQAANAVMNGTKVGNLIKGSSALGKIGQAVGTKPAQDIATGLVKEAISDATLGFGQNAIINYGEGLRGKRFWEQQAKDTALDFAIGGIMEGVGIGKEIRKAGKDAEAILGRSVTESLENAKTKEEYAESLRNELRGLINLRDSNTTGKQVAEASESKINDLMAEYRKALDMSDQQFNRLKAGNTVEEAVENANTKAETPSEKTNTTEEKTTSEKATSEKTTSIGKTARSPKSKGKAKLKKKSTNAEYTMTYEPDAPRESAKEPKYKGFRRPPKAEEDIKLSGVNQNKGSLRFREPTPVKENKTALSRRNDLNSNNGVSVESRRLRTADEVREADAKKIVEDNSYNIKKEIEENFPEATAQEREALETAMRNNDFEAYRKAEEDIRLRQENARNEASLKANETQKAEPTAKKSSDSEVEAEINRLEEKYLKNNATVSHEEGRKNYEALADEVKKRAENDGYATPQESPYWKHYEHYKGILDYDPIKVKAEPTVAEATPVKSTKEKPAKELSDDVKKALNGEKDWHELKFKDRRDFARANDIKVPNQYKGQTVRAKQLDEIIENGLREKNAPKVETVSPAKATKPSPSEIPTEKIDNIRKLDKGAFVVDRRYGVGKFTGIEKVDGERMARVEFADSAATYVPLDKVDNFLAKYAGEGEPTLGRMGAKGYESSNFGREGKMEKGESLYTSGSGVNPPDPNVNGTYTTNVNQPKALPKKPKKLTREGGKETIENAEAWKRENLPKKGEKIEGTAEPKQSKETVKDTIKERLNKAKTSDDVRDWGSDVDSIAAHYGREKVDWDGKTQKGWNTYENADITPAELQARMVEENENHLKKYVSNKSVLENAEARASKDFDEMSSTFFGNANAGRKVTSQDIADGYVLAREYIRKQDFDSAIKVYSELSSMESEVGRALQAQRLFKQLTPEGRLKSTISSIKRLEKARGLKLNIDTKLLDNLYNATTEAEQLKAQKAIAKSIWDQVPVKFIEKLNAWRYLSMLGNLKTHNRNVLGNFLLMPFRGMSDAFATGIERASLKHLDKLNLENARKSLGKFTEEELTNLSKQYGVEVKGTGKDGLKTKADYISALERTLADQGEKGRHALLNPLSKNNRELRKISNQEFKKLRDSIELGEMKFFDRGRIKESSIFKIKILDKLEKFNTRMLEGEDVIFMKANFNNAFVEYCRANKLNPANLDPKTLEKVTEYAYNEGLKSTYRDANMLADTINKIRGMAKTTPEDKGLKKLGKKAAGVAMDATIPFVKTPLNILKRGTLEYSPIGVFRGVFGESGVFKAKTAEEFLNSVDLISTGITGTGVAALGLIFAQQGLVNGTLGDVNDKTSYEKMLGKQNYAVNFAEDNPNKALAGKSITLDWIAPESIPFFVGVELGTALKDTDTPIDTAMDFALAMTNISEPIFELSMLQGVENIFNTAFSEKGGLGQMARNSAYGYLSQLVPTLAGQMTRFVTKDRQIALSTSDNPLTKEMQKQFGNILNKLPHINQMVNQDYVDQWGRTDSKLNWRDYRDGALENFIYPFYVSDNKVTDVDAEILRLYDALPEEDKEGVIPKFTSTAYKQKYNDKEYTMTPAEFTQYKKTVGQAKYEGLEKLFDSDAYKNASDEDKKSMIQDVYKDANKKGKIEYLKGKDKEFASAPTYYMMTKSQQGKWTENLNIDKEEWATAYEAKLQANREKQAKYGKDLTSQEIVHLLREHGITTYEQAKSIDGTIGSTFYIDEEKGQSQWAEAETDGKSFEQVQSEVIAKNERQKNMTVEQKKFDNYYKTRADNRYTESQKVQKTISKKDYDAFIYESQYVDSNTNNNGVITQAEAINIINNMDKMYGLTNEQKACYWYLAGNDKGWKRKPFGDFKP